MSIQDKIFDVSAALKDREELELFEDLVTYIGRLERRLEEAEESEALLEKLAYVLSRMQSDVEKKTRSS